MTQNRCRDRETRSFGDAVRPDKAALRTLRGDRRAVLPVVFGAALGVAIACLALGMSLRSSDAASPASPPSVGWRVEAVRPHDRTAFTQGLILADNALYESTGLNGRSSLRKVEIATGRVVRKIDLEPKQFGEGLALWGDELFVLTWRNGQVLVFDKNTFDRRRVLPLETQGWGLAATPRGLVSSDGGDTLVWRDPQTMRALGSVRVTDQGRPVADLNELEWVEGFVLANIWHEDRIAVINPDSGRVAAWIDLAGLRGQVGPLGEEAVLNGMAYDPATRRLYVTGKFWPKLFELQLENLPTP